MSNIAPINPTQSTSGSIPQPIGEIPTKSPSKKIERKDLTKKKIKWSYVIGGIILLMLIIGGGAGYWLTQQSQDIRQQASGPTYGSCSGSSAAQCQGKSAGDTCRDTGTCKELPNQIGADGKVKCYCKDNTPDPTPTPTPSPSPSVSPSPSPTPSVSPSPSPTPSVSPSPSVNPSPSPTDEPATYSCNSDCSTNSQCQTANSSYVCYQSKCRLDSNPTSDQCAQTTTTATTTTQPDLPAELPASGSEDIINWFKAGLGVLGIGTVLLLLL